MGVETWANNHTTVITFWYKCFLIPIGAQLVTGSCFQYLGVTTAFIYRQALTIHHIYMFYSLTEAYLFTLFTLFRNWYQSYALVPLRKLASWWTTYDESRSQRFRLGFCFRIQTERFSTRSEVAPEGRAWIQIRLVVVYITLVWGPSTLFYLLRTHQDWSPWGRMENPDQDMELRQSSSQASRVTLNTGDYSEPQQEHEPEPESNQETPEPTRPPRLELLEFRTEQLHNRRFLLLRMEHMRKKAGNNCDGSIKERQLAPLYTHEIKLESHRKNVF